jgi:hypothetical protein
MTQKNEQESQILDSLCNIINNANLNHTELISVLTSLLFSIGVSVEGCDVPSSSEEVLLKYSTRPTLGNALMAQAIYMKETWVKPEQGKERKDNEDVETTDAVQDL